MWDTKNHKPSSDERDDPFFFRQHALDGVPASRAQHRQEIVAQVTVILLGVGSGAGKQPGGETRAQFTRGTHVLGTGDVLAAPAGGVALGLHPQEPAASASASASVVVVVVAVARETRLSPSLGDVLGVGQHAVRGVVIHELVAII